MRILHVPHAYDPVHGGAELVCKRVSEELQALGHQVRVVTADVGSVDGYYRFGVTRVDVRTQRINGVEVSRIPYGGLLYEPVGRWVDSVPFEPVRNRLSGRLLRLIRRRFTERLAEEIDRYRPDVLMTLPHLVINVESVLTLQKRRRFDFPLVMLPLLHEHQVSWPAAAIRDALKYADAAVTLTEHEADRLRQAYGMPSAAVHFGGVGIDLPAHLPQPHRDGSVVFLGRKSPDKGILRLLEAMKLVWDQRPDTPLVLAGARTPDTGMIDAEIARLPEPQRSKVSSVDNVSETDKHRLLRNAACLVLPSMNESFGLVLLEAWTCETPVVTYDIPVFRCTVDHGENGLLVEPDSDRSMANAILTLVSDPELAARLGSAGRQKVVQVFNWTAVAERFLHAYEYAIAVRRNRSDNRPCQAAV